MYSPTLIHESRDPSRRYCRRAFGHRHAPYAIGIFTPFPGHWRSNLRRVACDRTGKAIPWYTYPATDFLLNAIFGIRQSLSSEADSPPFGGPQERITC